MKQNFGDHKFKDDGEMKTCDTVATKAGYGLPNEDTNKTINKHYTIITKCMMDYIFLCYFGLLVVIIATKLNLNVVFLRILPRYFVLRYTHTGLCSRWLFFNGASLNERAAGVISFRLGLLIGVPFTLIIVFCLVKFVMS